MRGTEGNMGGSWMGDLKSTGNGVKTYENGSFIVRKPKTTAVK